MYSGHLLQICKGTATVADAFLAPGSSDCIVSGYILNGDLTLWNNNIKQTPRLLKTGYRGHVSVPPELEVILDDVIDQYCLNKHAFAGLDITRTRFLIIDQISLSEHYSNSNIDSDVISHIHKTVGHLYDAIVIASDSELSNDIDIDKPLIFVCDQLKDVSDFSNIDLTHFNPPKGFH
jgi:hypothetical protein